MLFPTIEFALFFVAVFIASWNLVHWPQWRKGFLLLASYGFYATWDLRFVPLLIGASLFQYLIGLGLESTREKRPKLHRSVLALGVGGNLAHLALFKYADFFSVQLNALLVSLGGQPTVPSLGWVLPLGISFFTFQGISYIVDVSRGKLTARKNPLDVLLFIAFFPHLVAGPIVRAAEFLPQLERTPDPKNIEASRAFLLIALGLFKKMVLANYLGTEIADKVFENPEAYSAPDIWIGVYAYAMQIFCDFSAYSDMAIGFAALLGYEFPKNFNQPYRSESLQDFWRRWHMSLSGFLRDYLFIPLGGSRGSQFATYRNLSITMLLGGLWHGASWNFIVWGALHGFGLAIERYRLEHGPKLCECDSSRFWRKVRVFHFVCLSWVFFRAENLEVAGTVLAGMVKFQHPIQLVTPFSLLFIVAAGSLHFISPRILGPLERFAQRGTWVSHGFALGVVLVILSALSPAGIAPFIYFKF